MTSQHPDNIHTIVVHCSATREGTWFDAQAIDAMHRKRGFSMIGYHRVIRLDGSVQQGRPFNRRGAHVKGNNTNTIGICMIGGLDENGKAKDTFTDFQYHSLMCELTNMKQTFKNVNKIVGHRDFSPDLDGDGLIEPHEWIKLCPCFDVATWLDTWGVHL
jgi:N-acetylmuramoyl-L-alanine amidase